MEYFLWLFAHDRFTKGAKELLEKEDIFWSTRQDLDDLLKHVGLRPLPKLKVK